MQIGPYHVNGQIGSGGMGQVFAATHTRYPYPAAIKLLKKGLDKRGATAFEREVRAIAGLSHPHIVRILDRGIHEGRPWLAMERATGTVGFPRSWEELTRVLDEILQALGAAHAAGLLHLDVKPTNLLVRSDGSYALADFGIAAVMGSAMELGWGTPAYMAPERFDNRPERLTEATDLYAVACLAFHLTTGRAPFDTSDWETSANAHRAAPLPPMLPRFPIPPGLEDWIRIALARAPTERFASAAEALSALEELGPQTLVATHSVSSWPVGPTLPTLPAGQAVPLPALVGSPRPRSIQLSAQWPGAPRSRRLPGTGLGLLGLLAVPFAPRPQAQELLWTALSAVCGQGESRSVGLVGPRGVGRSRLGEELARAAASDAGVTVIRLCGGDPSPVATALESHFALAALSDPQRRREATALRLRRSVDSPVVDAILDLDAAGLVGAVGALARDRPVLLWADDVDLHPQALDAVARVLSARIPAVLTLCSVRDSSALDGALGVDTCVSLSPLETPTVRALLADWVGLRPSVVAEVAALAEGDMGLAIHIVQSGFDTGSLVPGPDGLRAPEGSSLSLPAAAIDAWEPALDALGDLGYPLEVAAVLGHELPLASLIAVVGQHAADALQSALLDADLVIPTKSGLRWVSATLRAAVLRRATQLDRAHAEAAETWDEAHRWERSQHHLERGDLEAALPDMMGASSEFIAKGHMIEAERRLDRARAAMESAAHPLSSPLWGRLWRAYSTLGPTHQGHARTSEYYERALDAARKHPDDPRWRTLRSSTVSGMIWHSNILLLPRRAEELVEEYLELGGAEVHKSPHFWTNRGWHETTRGQLGRAIACFEKALAIAIATGSEHGRHTADTGLGVAKSLRETPDALEHLMRSGDALLEAGFDSARADIAYSRAEHYRRAGELDEAHRWYQECQRATEEGMARADIGFGLGPALLLLERGDAEAAERALQGCIARLDDDGPTWEALLPLYIQSVRPDDPDLPTLRHSIATLEQTGFMDPNLDDALQRIVTRIDPADAPAIHAFAERVRHTIEAGKQPADFGGYQTPGPDL